MQLASFHISGDRPLAIQLRPGLNVLTTPDPAMRGNFVASLREALAGRPSNIMVMASIGGAPAFHLTPELATGIVVAAGNIDTVTDSMMLTSVLGAGESGSAERDRGTVIAITAALDALGLVNGTDPIPQLDLSTVEARYRDVRIERADLERGQVQQIDGIIEPAVAAREAAQRHLDLIERLQPAIKAAYAELAAADDAASKKFAGPASFNRLTAARRAMSEIMKPLGYGDYAQYQSDIDNAVARAKAMIVEADARIRPAQDQRVALVDGSTVELGRLRHEELLLRLRLGMDASIENMERLGTGQVPLMKLRRQIQGEVGRHMEVVLTAVNISTSEETVVEDAKRWLASRASTVQSSQASSQLDETKLTLAALSLRGRVQQHLAVEAVGGMPMIVDDLFAGQSAVVRNRLLPFLVDAATRLQIIYVTEDESMAAMVSALASP
jgi:hypothetical protein